VANYYWMRVRVVVGITTSPSATIIKAHSNRTEINADGFVEYFGKARPLLTVPWNIGMETTLHVSSPASSDTAFSNGTTNLTFDTVNNIYANNAIDAKGGKFTIPGNLDTSRSLYFELGWTPLVATGGNVEWEILYAVANIGSLIDGSLTQYRIPVVSAAGTTQDALKITIIPVDLSTVQPGAIIAFAHLRDASGANIHDTLAGNVNLIYCRIYGYAWS